MLEEQRATGLNRELFEALIQVSNERERLTELDKDVTLELPEPTVVAK